MAQTRNPMAPTQPVETTSPGERDSALQELDIAERVKRWYREARDGNSAWREEARKDYAFKAGEQWDPTDKANLKAKGRPCITYNRIDPIISAVTGVEVNNRQTIRYIPRTVDDAPENEVFTAASDFFRDQADSAEEETDAFEDMLTCGMGTTETRMDYHENPDGAMIDERVDTVAEMYWDPLAKKKNLIDTRYRIRVKRDIDLDDAMAMFPDVTDIDDLNATWANDVEDKRRTFVDREARSRYESDPTKRRAPSGKVTIVECQWWEYETVYAVAMPGGEVARLDKKTHAQLKKQVATLPGQTLQSTPQKVKKFKRAFVGNKLLDRDTTPPCDIDFTWQFITGKRDRNECQWYGLVRPMRDPQRWANGFMSAILHILQTSGKGMMMEETAVSDVRDFEERYAQPDAIKWLASGAVSQGKIFPIPNQALPSGLPDMMVNAISAIRDVTGVNLELLGLADRQQAGVLEQQRKQAGLTILATLYDSLRRYRKRKGKVVLWYIQHRLSDGRLVRIVGPEGAKYVPLTKQSDTATYDVIIDDTPTSPNSKEAVWKIVMQMAPVIMQAGLPPAVWAGLIRYSPLPTAVAEPIAQSLMQPKGPDPKMQLEQAKLQADVEGKKIDLQGKQMDFQTSQVQNQAKLQEIHSKAQAGQQKVANESQLAQQKVSSQAQLTAMELHAAQVKSQIDIALESFKLQAAMHKAEMDQQNQGPA